MKKVLIIAYLFPPRQEVGSQRPFGLAKHLPEYGWEPIILTAKLPGKPPEGVRIIQTDYKDITKKFKSIFGLNTEKSMHDQLGIAATKSHNYSTWKSKFIKICKELLLFPDDKKGWYSYAIKSAHDILKSEQISVIISTSPPAISHIIASKLKKKYNTKWIADYRDPWSNKFIDNRNSLLKYFDKLLEIRTISQADALVSVTKPYVDKIKPLHKDKNIYCISNGFNENEKQTYPARLTSKFTITYTGYLYEGKRDPSLLFQAVDELIKENEISKNKIEIRFYCHKEDWLIDNIIKFDLNGIVKLNGLVPKNEISNIQKESHLLLLIRWSSKKDMGDLPAKIFEYFDAHRPIIAIGGCGGIVKELLEETNTGKFADNLKDIKHILTEYYKDYVQFGRVECKSNDKIKRYSYKSIAKNYSNLLNSVVEIN